MKIFFVFTVCMVVFGASLTYLGITSVPVWKVALGTIIPTAAICFVWR